MITVSAFALRFGRIIIGLLLFHVWCVSGFDQNHRVNSLTFQGGTDSFATNNAFGSAFTSFSRSQAQSSLDSAITTGSLSILFSFPGLVDLRGSNATSMAVGVANGSPIILPGNPSAYNGASDLDWWYLFNRAEVDGGGNALQQLPASILGGVLNAGPGQFIFPNQLFGGGGTFNLSSAFLRANVGSSSAPLRSTNNFPPGHREDLDPALVSFAAMTQGQMRGDISAATLAATPIPEAMVGSGCNNVYTAASTLLDVIVGGCTAIIVPVIRATQPDHFDPNAPVIGAGPPYTFVRTGSRVTGARDRLGGTVDLQGALNASYYSTYFTFTTDRVIAYTEPSSAPTLINVTELGDGAVRFTFRNAPRASFSILSATNVELPRTNWTVVGPPLQTGPGLYEFKDANVTNENRRFYRVRSP